MRNPIVKEKIKITNLSKYGYEHNWQIPEEQIKSHSQEAIEKCIKTKKKNHTINSSKEEDQAYKILKEKYPDVVRQYRSKLYPFNCDFYIPILDLYIECQFGQFHHHRQYVGDDNDLDEVRILKEKSKLIKEKTERKKTRYDVEIETWMVRDVKKRECAKKNNLNYVEFWNLTEVEEWIK